MATVSSSKDQHYWDLWKQKRDPDAGNYIVKKYLPLVQYHVQRLAVGLPKNVSKDELRSFGLIGLYDAIEKFDQSRDLKFDTYASFRIRGSIIDGLRKEDWLPRSVREKAKKIEATIEKIEQSTRNSVTLDEIATELKIPQDEIASTMNEVFFANVLSIDEIPKDMDESSPSSYSLKDNRAIQPDDHLIKEEMLQSLAEKISGLSENEQLVVSLFYQEELTLTEIGQVLGLTTSRISQIHSRALFKLRKELTVKE
ncbi:FliA/WhiG family RNA polymerase sigma factor [Sutcliffiella cohnii]|uniref:FliA/WhiG family RNA polymerase sigma factor n=1 Tax=Sutcliffiella sp. NC1 TaxID=3004096 RepID=UPI0022DE1E44|nr:FliA/WhiG family RNA polymerase sigma factor [Sutcliffiella sp. NC1]WBL13270.1 FliA/WhiG family RNA polymerase sigma factor [Sutcliffiella sp. NC1]